MFLFEKLFNKPKPLFFFKYEFFSNPFAPQLKQQTEAFIESEC